MSETSTRQPVGEDPAARRSVRQALADVANPATIKGAIALIAGLSIIALPGLSQTLVELTLGAALVAAGLGVGGGMHGGFPVVQLLPPILLFPLLGLLR